MNKKNRKKGFTLVELIVVIAIIAILAAVAVPTTMHFVEKANISKEAQEMNIMTDAQALVQDTIDTKVHINLKNGTGISDGLKALKAAGGLPTSLGAIEYKVSAAAGETDYTVTVILYGTEYGNKKGGTLEATLQGKYTAKQIFAASTAADAEAHNSDILKTGNSAVSASYVYKITDKAEFKDKTTYVSKFGTSVNWAA